MKKIFVAAIMVSAFLPVAAQETYEMAEVSTENLNGTARYVGMGGAMEALGADISTMSSNPAGIGLFRSNQISGSFGLVSQSGESTFGDADKTTPSFDQMGIVFSTRSGMHSYINFGFNYHKSRNFNQLLSVNDRLLGASQSRLTYDKFREYVISPRLGSSDACYSQADVLYHEGLYNTNLYVRDANGNLVFNDDAFAFSGDDYQYNRGNTGYIGEYDFNLSGNINNRVYLGLTLGIHSVHYHGHSLYDERVASNAYGLCTLRYEDYRDITGTGYDVKAGIIVRPIEESPFRIGAYVHSPVFYKLESSNTTSLTMDGLEYYADGLSTEQPRNIRQSCHGSYEYEYRTPWKFGLSLGHTINNNIALGATYEYADYSTTDARIMGDTYTEYDGYWDEYYTYSESSSDQEMNAHVKQTLKGVSTLKLGAEFKPDPTFSVRLGYNYVSPMYKTDAYRGVDVFSDGNYNSSATDYVNWKTTHRLIAGCGFNFDNFKLDFAYQYQTQKGQFLPFTGDDNNLPAAVNVKDNRHQLLCTLTYSF